MTPADALDSHRRLIAENGATILVRRYAGTGVSRAVTAEASVLARVTTYQPHQIVGSVVQGDRRVIVLNDPSAVVPSGKVALASLLPLSTADKLVISGREVGIQAIDDETRRIQGTLIALEIQVRGN